MRAALGTGQGLRHHAAGARFLGLQHGARPAARRAPRHPLRSVRHRAGTRRHRLLRAARRGDPPRVPGVRRRLEEQDRHQRAASKAASTTSSSSCRRPTANCKTERLPLPEYLQIVAATNYKQRIRKTVEYLPRRPPELRRHRHAEPARVRPGLLREERRRHRRRQADRASLQDAGVRAGAAHEAAEGNLRRDPDHRHVQPARRARTSSISRCRTRRWISRCGRSTTASSAAELGAGARRSPKRRRSTCSRTSRPSARPRATCI